jgi:hypothetical protein
MNVPIEHPLPTRVYTTTDGRAVIEQPQGSVVMLSAEQILTVIRELHVCYDYCAAWREPSESTP